MGVATTTASAGTASMVLARSSTCAGAQLQHMSNTHGMSRLARSAETTWVCAGVMGGPGLCTCNCAVLTRWDLTAYLADKTEMVLPICG